MWWIVESARSAVYDDEVELGRYSFRIFENCRYDVESSRDTWNNNRVQLTPWEGIDRDADEREFSIVAMSLGLMKNPALQQSATVQAGCNGPSESS